MICLCSAITARLDANIFSVVYIFSCLTLLYPALEHRTLCPRPGYLFSPILRIVQNLPHKSYNVLSRYFCPPHRCIKIVTYERPGPARYYSWLHVVREGSKIVFGSLFLAVSV
jgi:hypothetical protein